jgi:hypothetical protein
MAEEEIGKGSLTIRLSSRTRKRVERLGAFGQSWDDLLNDIVDFIEDHEQEWFEEEE